MNRARSARIAFTTLVALLTAWMLLAVLGLALSSGWNP